ncbi:uncharacterized protein LOC127837581 [Dreissena polymorpha]|uniref:uncharacterized protein LOC127837581 n=1 Tax=Dreissena polymorpha TaxID=45954 RepID=UPI002264643E|nr:uncharacterized protein LOC127837581 [Dreissena polymorpha]
MLEASEDPALLPRFDISHDFGFSDVSASEDIALTRTSEFEPFDLTRAEMQPPVVIDERNLTEPAVSDSVLTQPETIKYTVVDAGTKRGKPKLVSSDGYSFTFKKQTKKQAVWRCSVRRKAFMCTASVTQEGDIFQAKGTHTHAADPSMRKKVELKRNLKTAAVADVFAASSRLVDDHIKVFEATYFNLPKPQTLTRILNRAREKHRPTDPSSLDFEVDTDFIGDGFLRGDVRVDGERHLIFASDDQLSRLQQSNRQFVDGTFHVVRKPFYQLYPCTHSYDTRIV